MSTGRRVRPPRVPRLYFSFRSPFSWMAIHRLRAEVPDAMTRFEFVPYWDPDARTAEMLAAAGAEFHYTQMSRAKHFYVLTDTKRLAADLGLPMMWPVDVDPWWELPHLGWFVAQQAGRAEQYFDAVTTARWTRGDDICTPEVLTAACEQAGVDAAEVLAAPESETRREQGTAALVQAYHDDVFGIPYIKFGRERYWGLDRLDHFLRSWRAAAESGPSTPEPERDAVPAGVTTAYDTDSAGGCG